MKKTGILVAALALSISANSQVAYNYLTAGNAKAQVNNNGMLFNDFDQDNIGLEIPKASGNSTIYTSSLWIGGLDTDDKLHLAAQTYGQKGSDYYNGPIDKTGMAVNPADWNEVYKLSTQDIELHKLSYTDANYEVPYNIKNWPIDLGANFEGPYAPFFDKNNNGLYEPESGEYPIIKGNEEIYYIMNDLFSIHGESTAAQMGIEVRAHAYVFNDAEIGNSVFVRYEIVNKSDKDYHDVHAGIFTDFDLGDFSDDAVGTDGTLNMYYAYNKAVADANYGAKPPAQGVVFLNHKLEYSVAYNNDFTSAGNPNAAAHYYNYLKAVDKDGNSFPNKLAFDGDPCNNTGNIDPLAGDKRMVGSTSAFNLKAGASFKFDVAYVYAQGQTNTGSVCELRNRVISVKQKYNNGAITSVKAIDENKHPVTVFPNPASTSATVRFYNPDKEAHEVGVYNSVGQLVYLDENVNDDEISIPLDYIPEGVYYVKVRKKEGGTSGDDEDVRAVKLVVSHT